MKKIFFLTVTLMLLCSMAFAAGVANDVLLRDRDGDYASFNSNGKIKVSF